MAIAGAHAAQWLEAQRNGGTPPQVYRGRTEMVGYAVQKMPGTDG
jgi:hypothetical protein